MTTTARRIEYMPLDDIVPATRNPKKHALKHLAQSVDRFGYVEPVVLDERTGRLVAGHGRVEHLRAARAAGGPLPDGVGINDDTGWLVPVVRGWASENDSEAEAYLVASNRLTELGGWDDAMLHTILASLDEAARGAAGFSNADFSRLTRTLEQHEFERSKKSLAERFVVPPFSILDARQGYWQDRKRAWVGLGIQSELGRGENPPGSHGPAEGRSVWQGTVHRDIPGYSANPNPGRLTFVQGERTEGLDPVSEKILERGSGTSIFDPVLCELAYRWFCPPGGSILDPFAGGSVRGITAAWLGRRYTGIDLSAAQIEANEAQAAAILPGAPVGEAQAAQGTAQWVVGDSGTVLPTLAPTTYDMVFSCPPYFDLERYSDDPDDLSNMTWPAFLDMYTAIIEEACHRMADDRFAVWVVGEVRDAAGNQRGLVPHTIAMFQNAGLELYNEAVLVTAVSSLPLRAGRQFTSSRKLGRTHQAVLGFVKGDWRKAVDVCGTVDVALPPGKEIPPDE